MWSDIITLRTNYKEYKIKKSRNLKLNQCENKIGAKAETKPTVSKTDNNPRLWRTIAKGRERYTARFRGKYG